MGQISIRLDDKTELKLKKEASINGKSLAEFCREKITEESSVQPINEVTLESRIEQLEKEQRRLANILHFQTTFLYQFAILAADEESAGKAWEKAKEEYKRKG